MVKCLPEFEYFYCVLEKYNIIFKIRRSKVTDYAALRLTLAKKRCEWECNKTMISENFFVFPIVKTSGHHLKVFVFKLNQIHICQTTIVEKHLR